MIPYGRQDINEDDIASVVEVLKSDYLTQGTKVPEFEAALCTYTHANHVLVCNSATSALHLACLALGLGEGDILWCSAITYVASVNCAFYCGAKVDLLDIHPLSYNLSIDYLETKLAEARKENKLPKILMVVHMAGQPCDMRAIHSLVSQYNIKIIEDASHAIGASVGGSKVGSCQYSDITVFSFHPVKIITTAEGGAALTNSAQLFEKMEILRSHGITRNPNKMTDIPHGPWYYEQLELGMNYRMTELQAILGVSQLKRIDQFVERRNYISDCYSKGLGDLPLKLPTILEHVHSAWHLYIVRLDLNKCQKSHLLIFEQLRQQGIGVNLHYIPLYKQPYINARLMGALSYLPQAESYYNEAISLPIYPKMTKDDIEEVISKVVEIVC